MIASSPSNPVYMLVVPHTSRTRFPRFPAPLARAASVSFSRRSSASTDGIRRLPRRAFSVNRAAYLGCYFDSDGLDTLLPYLLPQMGISVSQFSFPLICRSGINQLGQRIDYYLNYSEQPQQITCPYPVAVSLLDGQSIMQNEEFELSPWGVQILSTNYM